MDYELGKALEALNEKLDLLLAVAYPQPKEKKSAK